MTLNESTDRLLQLVDIPHQYVLICSCSYEVLVCRYTIERCLTSTIIDLGDTLIRSSIPDLNESILAGSHENMNQVFVVLEGLWAMQCCNRLSMSNILCITTFKLRQLTRLHIHDSHRLICISNQKVGRKILVLADEHGVM